MAMRKINMGAILAVAVAGFIATVLGALVVQYTIPNTATVKGVGVSVYWDRSCTNSVTSIDWGLISPGGQASQTIYIRNDGNVPVVLSMATNTWNPSAASNYITVNWNCTGSALTPNSVVCAALSMSVSSSISGVTSFTFNIVITGTEQ